MTQTQVNTGSKWFYPFQEQISQRIESNNYSRSGYCIFQEVTKDRYFECWDLVNNETGKYTQMVFVVNRATGFIFSYNSATGI